MVGDLVEQRTSDWCQLSLHNQNDRFARKCSWSASTGSKLQNHRQKMARPPAESAANTPEDSRENRQIGGVLAKIGNYEQPPNLQGRSPPLIGRVVKRAIDASAEQANSAGLFDHHIWLKEKTNWPRERIWSCLREAEAILGRESLLEHFLICENHRGIPESVAF